MFGLTMHSCCFCKYVYRWKYEDRISERVYSCWDCKKGHEVNCYRKEKCLDFVPIWKFWSK